MNRIVPIAALLLVSMLPASAFDFALIGDVPYSAEDSMRFGRLQERINAADVEFVLHVGDVKGGSVSCADEALAQRRDWFDQFDVPFLLIPGDNDWTDCHREGAGSWAPLDRLAKLRELFFSPPGHLLGGGSLKVQTQAADPAYRSFPEHLRWKREKVWFVNLHIVGSSNGRRGFEGRTAADDAEVEARTKAAIRWMRETFELARQQKSAGVMVGIHANPRFEAAVDDTSAQRSFGDFLLALRDETIAFGKPVVLVHGDSHYFRIDKPLKSVSGRKLDYFTRVESFGSPHMHWVRVSVDPADPMVFRFQQEIIPEHAIRR